MRTVPPEISEKSFGDARLALKQLSLYLEYRHRKAKRGAYRCPLRFNPVLAKQTSKVVSEIEEIDRQVSNLLVVASWEAFSRIDPKLREAAAKERDSIVGTVRLRAIGTQSDYERFAKTQHDWKKKIAARRGARRFKKRRERLVSTIFARHAGTLRVLDKFLPALGGGPISRKDARDTGNYISEHFAPTDELEERVKGLASAIDQARDTYLRFATLAHRTNGAGSPKNAGEIRPRQRRRRKNPKPTKEPKLTEIQTETVMLVGEFGVTGAAKKLKKHPSTVQESYKVALGKLGRFPGKSSHPKTQSLPTDRRGQSIIPEGATEDSAG